MNARIPMHAGLAWAAGLRTHADAVACATIALAVLGLKLFLLEPIGPVVFYDELLYKLGADALGGLGKYQSGQYPFLYPAMLAPALAAGLGYVGIFYTNAIVSTAIIPAAWSLARTVGMRWAWPAALLSALLPIHWTYPTQVLSENLSVPLFLWVTWYAVRGRPTSVVPAFVFGTGLAALALTKYLLLPSIPVLWAIWLYGMRHQPTTGTSGTRKVAAPALASVLGITALVTVWFAYAHTQGIGIGEASGSRLVKFNARNLITPAAVLTWVVAYLSAIILLVAPFLPRLLEAGYAHLRSPLGLMKESPLARLSLLTVLLLGGYLLICARHSAFAVSNYPVPQHLIVRYFMQITPLVMVLGLALVFTPLGRTRFWAMSLLALASSLLVLAAHRILYANAIWDFPDWFARIPLYSTDIRGYAPESHVYVLALLVLLSALTPIHSIIRNVWLASLFTFMATSTALTFEVARSFTSVDPMHARSLAPLVLDALRSHERVIVITEIKRAGNPSLMQQALEFWGADPKRFEVVGPRYVVEPGPSTAIYRISSRKHEEPALREYAFGSSTGYIYDESDVPRAAAPAPVAIMGTLALSPAYVCKGATGSTSLTWNAGSNDVRRVAIYVEPDGAGRQWQLFTLGPPSGSRQTPPWVAPGMHFEMRDDVSGRVLAQATVQQRECQ